MRAAEVRDLDASRAAVEGLPREAPATLVPRHGEPMRHESVPSLLALGAVAILAQSVLLRELLVVFFGNELSLGLGLGSWLLGIFLGAWLGARLASRWERRALDPEPRFGAVFLLLLGSVPVALIGVRGARFLVGIPGGELVPLPAMVLVCLITLTPCASLVGCLFPVAALLARSRGGAAEQGADPVGRVYVLESLGSLLGGAAFTLLVLPRGSAVAGVLLYTTAALASLAWLRAGRGGARRSLPVAALALLAGAALLGGAAAALDGWSVGLRWRSYKNGLTLRASRDTPYQSLQVAGDDPYHLYANGQVVASFPDPWGYASRVHPLLLEHPDPRRVLLLGGGVTGMVREILRHPVERLDLVEADPGVLEVVRAFLPAEDREALADPRVRLLREDPRRFLMASRDRYDLVLLVFPDPTTAAINRFYTREHFEQVRARLAPGGAMATRISSASNYLGGAMLALGASVHATLREVFREVEATPGEETWLLASDTPGVVSLDPEVLKARLAARRLEAPGFYPEVLDLWLPADRVRFLRESLNSAAGVPINTDLRPVSYFYGLLLWDRYSGGRLAYSLSWLARAPPGWLALPLLVPLALLVPWVRRRPEPGRAQALLAIASTGFASMAWSLVLLLAFQDVFGSLYREVALLVAVFMLGLALGAEALRRWRPRNRRRALVLTDLAMLVFGLLLVPLAGVLLRAGLGPGTRLAFLGLLLGAGALTGAQFPAASALYLERRGGLARTAGRIDAADNLGAMLGAVLTGLLLVPLLGIQATALGVGLLKLGSLLACLPGGPGRPGRGP